MPSTGEPEDLITQMDGVLDPSKVPEYYELVVTAESRNPPGAEPEAICDLCGRESYNEGSRRLVSVADAAAR